MVATLRLVNVFGDIERFLATNLYPNRIAIGIALALLTAALLVAAQRRGWFEVAVRHPGRTGAVIVLALATAVPVAWYLASPLFIRTALDEPTPTLSPSVSAPVSTAGSPDGTLSSTPAQPSPTPGPTFALAASRTGTFHGADEFHFGSGTASLIETGPGSWTVRFEGFSVRNGPDLYVYVSPDASGYGDDAIELGRLKATDGNFNMDLPAGSVPVGAASVVIWCKQFAVQFAVAPLNV
ncbi:MAG: DM13 domain-containing protein [Candidatus Limnocylindrales bacterium]